MTPELAKIAARAAVTTAMMAHDTIKPNLAKLLASPDDAELRDLVATQIVGGLLMAMSAQMATLQLGGDMAYAEQMVQRWYLLGTEVFAHLSGTEIPEELRAMLAPADAEATR